MFKRGSGSHGRSRSLRSGGRVRWVALFTALLLVLAAVPVLAAESASAPTEEIVLAPSSLEAQADWLPDAADIQEGFATIKRDEAARELALESPQAVREREDSREAFAGVDAAEARGLLQTLFAEQLAKLNADPARSLGDAEIVRTLGETVAMVTEDGDGALLDAGIPVKTEDEDGELRKVDLGLKATVEGFETANALSRVRIGDSADEPIEVGEEGIAISQLGAAEASAAQRFGEQNIFHFEALTDTDILISPTAFGVEIFNLLRSEESPETLRFEIALPDGAELRADGRDGAEIVRGAETLAAIPFPTAVDAQGTDVPIELSIEGNSIALHVEHREGDYAMPILVDPAILEDWVNSNQSWINGYNLNALSNGSWQWTSSPYGLIYFGTSCFYTCWGSGRGLYVSAPSRNYGASTYSQWAYSAPNLGSYISKAWLIPFWRDDHECNKDKYPQPHDYDGFWGDNQWNLLQTNQAIDVGSVAIESWGRAFVVGLHSGGGINIPCWRDLVVGGAAIWLDDWEPPKVNSVTGLPPSEWLSDTTPVNISVNASDGGLGIYRATITPDGKGPVPKLVGCTGLYVSRCPTSTGVGFSLTGLSFGEGIRNAGVVVEDPTGKTAGSSFQTKVDRTPPEVTLDNQLAEMTEEDKGEQQGDEKVEKLRLPVYNLKIEAEDGKLDNNLTKRSGVKDIEVFLDGKELEVPWSPQSCPATSCKMTQTYQLKLSTLATAGLHALEVKVRDQVNNVRTRSINFEYFPATGIRDEYVMHYFPLPDGSGNEAEEEHPDRPELAVNVMNGNLVYREQDVEVEGPAVDLEVERYYNSMLPDPENTEWGDGWTLAQTPDLEPLKTGGSPVANEAKVLDPSGAIENGVQLPTEAGQKKFDPALRRTLLKKSSGGYEMTDETGESATSVAFDETGQTEALVTEGYAKVDYSYEGGELAEIEVTDPATFTADPSELEIPEPQLITEPTYASSFGSNGAGDGQLKSPSDVAVDSKGYLWVVDKSNNRIQKLSSAGQFLSKFGSSGSGNGQFNRPTSIAIAANGDLLVTDAGNGRVQRFNSAGAFLSKFGAKGTGNGQFTGSGPEGIAIDSAGNIWVSDTYGGRVQKFNPAGEFVKVVGSKGSGSGQLGEPTGVDFDPSGNLWVADWQNNRVSVFNNNGEFLSQFGSAGAGDGQFNHPDAMEVDAHGNVWVGDQNNSRIQQFDLAGQFKGKFGSAGSGQGQFSFTYPMGIAADSKGHLWITDVNNHRVQQWLVPIDKPTYANSFGSNGTGDGQLKSPGDVAVGFEGNLWVVDESNDRIQKFSPDGQFLSKFGSSGSGDGQFNRPSSIAIDRDGNLIVSDAGNSRIQKFSSGGQFLTKFGSKGTANGQFAGAGPESITTDFQGNIWVSDTYSGRLQKFDEEGQFVEVIGSKGSGAGQLGYPAGIDVDAGGNVWVADWQHNRVSVFDADGEFLSQFGSAGTGDGQFNHPLALEIDSYGNVWVGDQSNNRVQRFDLAGQYVDKFGSSGSGEGQFNLTYPMGIAADRRGHLWATDVNNHRVQQWLTGNFSQPPATELDLSDGDPKVEVETPGGLVSSVTGSAAGEHTYEHVGAKLTAHDGPQGETAYQYDAAGRMTEVTLPNGTWGSIAYDTIYGRVKSVTVDPAGADPAKKTEFEYTDAPARRTVVIPPGAPHVTYDIGEDGSVLKWWNALQPPVFDDLAGSLYENKEKDDALWTGDHYLDIQAHSEEGIASIYVLSNGNELAHETTCEQTEAPGIECKTLISEWVTNTELHVPGHLNVEVLITDRLGHSASERFWVDIPEPPPPPAPGTPIPPKFADILRFREEYGLEIVFPVANEIERNERIFNLLNAWYQGDPVARASRDRWGVPLRPVDVAEMEYREWLYHVNAERIDQWVQATSPSSYAGYYIDHPAGGVMRVGFLDNQAEQLESLKASLPLVAGERLGIYPTTPTVSYLSVQATSQSVSNAVETNPTLGELVVSVADGEAGKVVRVGTPNVVQVEGILDQMFGPSAPIVVEHMTGGSPLSGRYRNSGRMRAGDNILSNPFRACTAGFGAYDEFDIGPKMVLANFVLTAGHCFLSEEKVYRSPYTEFENQDEWGEVGEVRRNAFTYIEGSVRTDAEAIRMKGGDLVPRGIFGWDGKLIPTEPASKARVGNRVCFSGARSQTPSCGPVLSRDKHFQAFPGGFTGGYWVKFDHQAIQGDSGSPVWNPRTGASIGLVTAKRSGGQTLVEPLLHPPNMNANHLPGILHNEAMAPLHLKLGE